MALTFKSIHDRLIDKLRKDLYYCDMNDILFDYDFVSIDDVSEEEEVIDIISENQIIINDNIKKNRSVLIKTSHFLNQLFKSFKFNIDRITAQFDLDFPRSSLYYNHKKYTKNEILRIFNCSSKYVIKVFNQMMPFDKFLMMMCTQGSFACSFILMSYIYNNDTNHHFVTSYDASYNIYSSGNILNIELKATYHIKNTKTNLINQGINVTTKIDLVKKNQMYEPSEMIIIFWNITE